jgi:hypothetical protein
MLVIGGGAAVVAGTQNAAALPVLPTANPPAPTGGSTTTTSEPAASAGASASAAATPTAAPTSAPGTTQAPPPPPVRTQPPVVRTPPPPPPAANSVTLPDGSVVTYSGPTRLDIGSAFTMTFTVRTGNVPGTGTLLVSFGNASTGGSKATSGTLVGGQFTVQMAGQPLPGNYPVVVNFKGYQGTVATIRIG